MLILILLALYVAMGSGMLVWLHANDVHGFQNEFKSADLTETLSLIAFVVFLWPVIVYLLSKEGM